VTESRADGVRLLAERLEAHLHTMRTRSYLGVESWRADRERVYDEMFEAAGRFVGGAAGGSTLSARTVPEDRPADAAAQSALAAAIAAKCGAAVNAGAGRDYVRILFEFLQRTRALLAEAVQAQAAVNSVLGRPSPRRPFTATDLDMHNSLRGAAVEQLPYLLNEVMEYFRIRIVVSPEAIEVTGGVGAGG
jgi:hypothetical protein